LRAAADARQAGAKWERRHDPDHPPCAGGDPVGACGCKGGRGRAEAGSDLGLAWPDATETAARIRRGELTAAEVVETAIARAEALQPRLNFLVASDFDRALDKARTGAPGGPFGGAPFLVKDLVDYKGLPTRAGSQANRSAPPAIIQAPNCDAFDRAGLVVIGKSATPEFGFLPLDVRRRDAVGPRLRGLELVGQFEQRPFIAARRRAPAASRRTRGPAPARRAVGG
jgi:hypothetical protein